MNRSRLVTLLGLLAGPVAVVVAGVGCHGPDSAATEKAPTLALPPVAVETSLVEIRKMPRFLTLTGSITADRQSEVAANVAGRIASAPIERGQKVKEGQTLAIVDSKAAGLSAAASSAQAQLADNQVTQAQED